MDLVTSEMPPASLSSLITSLRQPLLMVTIVTACIVVVWLRNHDILRDLFDYSTVITAAGKVEAGFKPYVDVRSPMQSAVYLFNYATEQVFGRNYLALTRGGLVQALGGALLIAFMLRHCLGSAAATLVALGMAMAGLLQHMVFFYNPIGILCFAVVLLGLAIEPTLWPVRDWRTVAIYCALIVGGINKLNFQGATLVLAGLLGLAAWANGTITRGAWIRNVALLGLAGCGLPLAAELLWTGATFQEWYANVVLLPGARHHVIARILEPGLYLRPVYDFHHHVLVGAIGGVGLLVLLATGGWLLWEARVSRRPAGAWLARLGVLSAGCILGALLMVTNHESVVLTSLAYPLLSMALYLQHRVPGRSADRWVGRALLAAIAVWLVVGGYAAWHGSRVLYAPDPPPRSAYVRLNSASPALAYLNGVRLLPEQIDALERVAAKIAMFEGADGKLPGILFGPALEWLERAYPEAMVPQEPIWYHAGTTLHDGDDRYFQELLGHGSRRLITHKFWQAWPQSIERLLAQQYRVEAIGSRDVIYHPRGPALPPADRSADRALPVEVFRNETGSNLLLSATRCSEGMALHAGPSGPMFGATRNSSWAWPLGANVFQGRAAARLEPDTDAGGTVTFRIMSGHPETGDLLWESSVALGPWRREEVLPFEVQPAGRTLWLQTVVENAGAPGALAAGWRDIRITHATVSDRSTVLPYGRDLRAVPGRSGDGEPDCIWYIGTPEAAAGGEWFRIPAQNWRRAETPLSRVSVEIELNPNPADPAYPVVVTLAWYRAGRFEIMASETIDLRVTRRVTLAAPVTEAEGWVGVLTRPAGGDGAGHQMRIVSWENH